MIFITLSDAIDKRKTDPDVGLFTFLLIETCSMCNLNCRHAYVHADLRITFNKELLYVFSHGIHCCQ